MTNPWDSRFNSEHYQYGENPNSFLTKHAHHFAPQSHVLALADGEGRNGVWLAQQGLQVLSVDGSQVGLDKATRLASSQGVEITTECADLNNWTWPEQKFDALVTIFLHMPSAHRQSLHNNMIKALKPGGVLLMEVFSKDQLGRSSGGPPNEDWLYSEEEVLHDFAETEIIFLDNTLDHLDEGPLHQGEASLIRFIARAR